MRFSIFIIIVVLLTGCNGCASKRSVGIGYGSSSKNLKRHYHDSTFAAIAYDSVVYGRDSLTRSNGGERKIRIGAIQAEKVGSGMVFEKKDERSFKPKLFAANAAVIDNASEVSPHKGIIAYSVPDTMTVGLDYSIKVRITREKGEKAKQEIIVGDQHIAINDTTVHSTIVFDSIRVENIMSAVLLSADSAFSIKLLSSELQNIEDRGYTEWEWAVNPQYAGRHPLKLIVKVKIKTGGTFKDIVVFEKAIKTQANYVYSTERFVTNNWHYLMSSIIIPLLGWWWKKRQDKKKGQDTTPPNNEV